VAWLVALVVADKMARFAWVLLAKDGSHRVSALATVE
jgi:hypothetical protein